MSILFNKVDGVLIVSIGKRLDTNNAPDLEKLIDEKIQEGSLQLVFDFAKTDYISSAGLRVILKTAKILKKPQGSLVLCQTNEQVKDVLEISGFNSIITVYDNLDEAIEAVADYS